MNYYFTQWLLYSFLLPWLIVGTYLFYIDIMGFNNWLYIIYILSSPIAISYFPRYNINTNIIDNFIGGFVHFVYSPYLLYLHFAGIKTISDKETSTFNDVVIEYFNVVSVIPTMFYIFIKELY